MLDITDPDGIAEESRRSLRIESEYAAFDAERYLGDFFGAAADPLYADAMAFSPFWANQWDKWKAETEISLASSACRLEESATSDFIVTEPADKSKGALSAALIPSSSTTTTTPPSTTKDAAFDAVVVVASAT
jgi:hypothetical protein